MNAQNLIPVQKRYLKQLAHPLKPLLQIGKEGASPAFIGQTLDQLEAHELLKLRVLNNCSWSSEQIRAALEAAEITFVQKVGHVLTVFKQREQDSAIQLPQGPKKDD